MTAPNTDPAPAADPSPPTAPDSPLPFPVVGLGASAGGLAAFEAFFQAMSEHDPCGMAFVLVQHLSPDHKSLLVDLVRRYTRMQVVEAGNGMALRPDCAYIIPPNHDMALRGGALRLTEHPVPRGLHLTVDHFFRSLALAQREHAIGIVLSGTGSDGSLGVRAIKGEGGLVVAQAPDSTEYAGMPRSAIATGTVDLVLAPAEMPAQLIAYARQALDPRRRPGTLAARDSTLKKVCALLLARTGHDFLQYKETTLLRRIERRMALHQIERADQYLRHLRDNPLEVEALFQDLLIGVTSFFRDPEAFKLLEERVIPRLLQTKDGNDAVRVWVCGCSTGEEAYSIAMLLHEQQMAGKQALKVQVFGTDIDRQAIETARAGVYPASIAADIGEERLARYFILEPQRGSYRIQKHIRDMLVFSEQDVTKDPPFSRLDLVSCRNLLIYLNTEVQRKLIPLFHYALVPGGTLFLGTSETVGESAPLFTTVDRKWKLYTRLPAEKGRLRPALPTHVPPLSDAPARRHGRGAAGTEAEPGSLRQVTEQALLAHYAQAGVLVNERGQILHIVGRTGQFLEPGEGDAALNILPMAREGLRRELTVALHKAVAQHELVAFPGLRVKANGHWIVADLVVRPVEVGSSGTSSTVYLVILEETPEPADRGAEPAGKDDERDDRIVQLLRELRAKDEYLQTTLEEMETTNEELKSTNEEMQSVNEELQSTNEELETSKEELQSVNEELSTVNAELQDKVADLSRAYNDMNNLLAGTGVGTVFVDHELRIARFTPAATQVINLIPGDVGRPLAHVATNLVGYDRLGDDIRGVLETLSPCEAEVQARGGTWYLMGIRPYRTTENQIEGAVLTLVDISERKKTEASLRSSEARLRAFIEQAYAGVAELDTEGRFSFVNDRLCQMLGRTRDELLQRRLLDVTDPADMPALQQLVDTVSRDGGEARTDKRFVCADGKRLRTHDRFSGIRERDGRLVSVLMISVDLPAG